MKRLDIIAMVIIRKKRYVRLSSVDHVKYERWNYIVRDVAIELMLGAGIGTNNTVEFNSRTQRTS